MGQVEGRRISTRRDGPLTTAPHVCPCPEPAEGAEVSDQGLALALSTDAGVQRGCSGSALRELRLD